MKIEVPSLEPDKTKIVKHSGNHNSHSVPMSLQNKCHLFNGIIPNIQSAIDQLGYYKNQYYTKFPNSKLEIISIDNKYAIVQNEIGICKITKGSLLFGNIPDIRSSIDKLSYYKSQFEDRFKDSKIDIIKFEGKYIIVNYCDQVLKYNSKNFLYNGIKCNPIIDKTEYYINKANIKHNFKYDYSKSNIKLSNDKISIICPIHGEFEQMANNHLSGEGCRKCQYLKVSESNIINNIGGYSLTSWIEKGNKSKYFDSFKVYIIECWNDEERFYKIGRTFTKIEKRFRIKSKMPYDYKIVDYIEGTPEYIFNLENKIKRDNKQHKYLPKNKFNGKHECFSKLEKELR